MGNTNIASAGADDAYGKKIRHFAAKAVAHGLACAADAPFLEAQMRSRLKTKLAGREPDGDDGALAAKILSDMVYDMARDVARERRNRAGFAEACEAEAAVNAARPRSLENWYEAMDVRECFAAFAALPPPCAAVARDLYLGLTLRETAAANGVSTSAILRGILPRLRRAAAKAGMGAGKTDGGPNR